MDLGYVVTKPHSGKSTPGGYWADGSTLVFGCCALAYQLLIFGHLFPGFRLGLEILAHLVEVALVEVGDL